MSYDENRISDLIDGGLLEEKQKFEEDLEFNKLASELNSNTMETVKLKRNFPYEPKEIEIPERVTKEWVEDYQDNRGYWKYFYINKKGKKKECRIEWV